MSAGKPADDNRGFDKTGITFDDVLLLPSKSDVLPTEVETGTNKRVHQDQGHAPGHRHLASPPDVPGPHMSVPIQHQHHQAWLGTGGRVDRLRRNERHGDEKKD